MIKYVLRNNLNQNYFHRDYWLYVTKDINSATRFTSKEEAETVRVEVLEDNKFIPEWEIVKVID